MDDNANSEQVAYVRISSDEYGSGQRALRVIDLAVFLFRATGPDAIESAGHSLETFVDLIDDQTQAALSCFEASKRR